MWTIFKIILSRGKIGEIVVEKVLIGIFQSHKQPPLSLIGVNRDYSKLTQIRQLGFIKSIGNIGNIFLSFIVSENGIIIHQKFTNLAVN